MPFSNIDLIRKHLVDSEVAQAAFRDVPVRTSGTSPVALLHRNLISDSIVVKGKEISTPHFIRQTLESEPIFLGRQQLIPDSVAIASDTSLGVIYSENVDFQVDHETGHITRLEGGAIQAGSEVAIWFYAYTIYRRGTDYFVDGGAGTIRRTSDSLIEDGQVVFIDYRTLRASFSDAQIENATAEANGRLKQLIAPEHHHSTEQSLISAETYLALAILFRVRAAATLQNNSASQSATVAREWLELAESYDSQAVRLASAYAPPRSALAGPSGITARSKR